MTAALNWIKERTVTKTDEPITVEGVTYEITIEFFAGHLPRRMNSELAKAPRETGDLVNEVVRTNPKTGFTEYSRTVYAPIAA